MKTDPPNAPADAVATLLSDLEGKARAATKGPWHQPWPDQPPYDVNVYTVTPQSHLGITNKPEDAAHIAAFDPDTCLALIEVARAAGKAREQLLKADVRRGGNEHAGYRGMEAETLLAAALARLGERSET